MKPIPCSHPAGRPCPECYGTGVLGWTQRQIDWEGVAWIVGLTVVVIGWIVFVKWMGWDGACAGAASC